MLYKMIEFECIQIPDSKLKNAETNTISTIIEASKDIDHLKIDLDNMHFHKTRNDRGESIMIISHKRLNHAKMELE